MRQKWHYIATIASQLTFDILPVHYKRLVWVIFSLAQSHLSLYLPLTAARGTGPDKPPLSEDLQAHAEEVYGCVKQEARSV